MANRNYPASRIFGFHLLPIRLDARVSIGASGAPTIMNALGIASISRLAAGTYRIQLQDNYYQFLCMNVNFKAPVTGSAVPGGSFSPGTVYEIVSLGTTTQAQWVAAGLPPGITAAPGEAFLASAIGAGSGTVKAIGTAGIDHSEIVGNPQSMLSNQPFNSGSGGFITFQTMTSGSAADPASGSVMHIEMMLNNSGVQ